jgi:hypothetical protein
MEVLVFIGGAVSARLAYTLDLVLGRLMGCSWKATSRMDEYISYPHIRLNYSHQRGVEPEVWLRPQGLLNEVNIRSDLLLDFGRAPDGLPYLFKDKGVAGPHIDFDLLAASFFMASRYEEYLPFEADLYGRFPSAASLSAQAQWLHEPVVQLWAERLGACLADVFSLPPFPRPPFQRLLTYDIDIPWAYALRGWRGWARASADLLSGKWALSRQRLSVALGREPDPYDTFNYLDALHQRLSGPQPAYFMLMAPRGPFDPGAPPEHPKLKRLIAHLADRYAVGIHPSYRSNEQAGQLEREVGYLTQALERSITISRQHFLKLRFPHTYRRLLEAGIREDYSLAFADAPGFRAGLAIPFLWYDLEREHTTELRLIPTTFMEVTLRDYLGLGAEEAAGRISALRATLQKHGGWQVSLWHNSSFSPLHGWEGWREVYEREVAG